MSDIKSTVAAATEAPEELKQVVESKLSTFHYVIWAAVIILTIASVSISYVALKRSTLDNDSIRSLNEISLRMKTSLDTLTELNKANLEFNQNKDKYVTQQNTQTDFNYEDLVKKYGNPADLGASDDGSNKWLFSSPDDKRSNQSPGNK